MRKQNRPMEVVTSVVILLPALAGLLLWNDLPERMAIHWGFDALADGWGSRAAGVFLPPLLLLGLHWLCLWLTGRDPKNREQHPKAFGLVLWIVPVLSLLTGGMIYSQALGLELNQENGLLLVLGAMFLILGNYLPKIRQNHTLGIRLPWTVRNEENWNKTHRLGGMVWVLGGALLLVAVLLPGEAKAVVLLLAILAMALIPAVYSWLLYRRQCRDGGAMPQAAPVDRFHARLSRFGTVIAVAVVILVAMLLTTGDLSLEYGKGSFSVRASYWSDMTVAYEDIQSVAYREQLDPGSRTSGFGSPRLLMGRFENDEFGSYTRYSYTKCPAAVVLDLGEDILVLSGKDAPATAAMYEALLAQMP